MNSPVAVNQKRPERDQKTGATTSDRAAFDPCAGCGADLHEVGLAVWNDRGRWCSDCEREAMKWPA